MNFPAVNSKAPLVYRSVIHNKRSYVNDQFAYHHIIISGIAPPIRRWRVGLCKVY